MTTSETASFDDDGMLARAVMDATSGEATAAEAELYRRFAPRVRLYGLKHLRDRTAADDLAQQVMLTVIERLRAGDVREPDRIGSFILGTSRMTVTALRRSERRRERLNQWMGGGDSALGPTFERAVDESRVAPCLDLVRERERTILILSFYAEQSAAAIGESLGMTAVAVRVARHRALEAMRECVESRIRP